MTHPANRAVNRFSFSSVARFARVSFPALLALLCLAQAPFARADYDVLEAPELRLFYSAPAHSFIAPYAARCFANSLRFYAALFGYAPKEKVTIFLDDGVDYGNAGSGAARGPALMDVATSNFVYETGPSNERINFTMNHEVSPRRRTRQATGSGQVLAGRSFRARCSETNRAPGDDVYALALRCRAARPRAGTAKGSRSSWRPGWREGWDGP